MKVEVRSGAAIAAAAATLLIAGAALPLLGDSYLGVIGTRACIYWVLASGLNLVVGFGGQIAIGWVALLTLGAYTTSVLVAGNVGPAWPPYLALAVAAVVGAVFGLIVGLPALRLRTFYFAITTLGFATIVTQVALAWQSVTGGGVGLRGPKQRSRVVVTFDPKHLIGRPNRQRDQRLLAACSGSSESRRKLPQHQRILLVAGLVTDS